MNIPVLVRILWIVYYRLLFYLHLLIGNIKCHIPKSDFCITHGYCHHIQAGWIIQWSSQISTPNSHSSSDYHHHSKNYGYYIFLWHFYNSFYSVLYFIPKSHSASCLLTELCYYLIYHFSISFSLKLWHNNLHYLSFVFCCNNISKFFSKYLFYLFL